MSQMTTTQALTEARRRWGKNAAVQKHRPAGGRDPDRLASVGRIALGMFFEILGEGASFEAAFAAADRSEARDRARFCRAKPNHNPTQRCRACKYRGPPGDEFLGQLQAEGTLLCTPEIRAAWERTVAESRAWRKNP